MVRAGNQEDRRRHLPARPRRGTSILSSTVMPCSPTWSRERTTSGARWRTRSSTARRCCWAPSTVRELARGLKDLGYDIEKTHADGRFEIAGVLARGKRSRRSRAAAPRSRRRWKSAGSVLPGDNPRIAERAALMTRAKKRDIDRDELQGRVAAPGRRSRPRCRRAGRRRGGKRSGRAGTGSGGGTGQPRVDRTPEPEAPSAAGHRATCATDEPAASTHTPAG